MNVRKAILDEGSEFSDMKKAAPDQERLPDTANLDDADMAFWGKSFFPALFLFQDSVVFLDVW